MTRAALLAHVSDLDAIARTRGMRANVTLGQPAPLEDVSRCETALEVRLPRAVKESLLEWNGCVIDIYEDSNAPPNEMLQARFVLLDLRMLTISTLNVRSIVVESLAGTESAANATDVMSRFIVISNDSDICVLVRCGEHAGEEVAPVFFLDLEYDVGPSLPGMRAIASSADDYIVRSIAQLGATLKTEIYWW